MVQNSEVEIYSYHYIDKVLIINKTCNALSRNPLFITEKKAT